MPGTRARRIAAAVLVLAAAATWWLTTRDQPEPLRDLGRAQSAGDLAARRSEEILADLEDIAQNLDAGAGLSQESEEIRSLTRRQRESLRALTDVLRKQIAALRRGVGAIEGTERSAIALADLSAQQAAAIRRSVQALERLRDAAARSGAMSADFAVRALYAARLAEDSQKAFSDG